MKIIEGLNDQLQHWEDNLTPAAEASLPTFKKFYSNILGSAQGKTGDESIEMFLIGMKLKKAGDVVELEDAEHKLLLEKVTLNQNQVVAHFHAQLILKLK